MGFIVYTDIEGKHKTKQPPPKPKTHWSILFLRTAKNTPDLQKLGLLVSSTIHTLLQKDQPKNTGRPNKGQN